VDPTFDVSQFSQDFKRAITDVRAAKADMDLSAAIGDQTAFAKATDVATEATKRLRVAAKDLRDVIANSPDLTPTQRTAGIEALDAAIRGSTEHAKQLSDTFRDVGNAVGALGRLSHEMGLFDDNVTRTIDDVGRLLSSIGDVSDLAKELKGEGKGGLFSSFGNLLKSIPLIGQAISSAFQLGKDLFNTITGAETKKANDAILKQNNQELERLRQDLKGFAETPDQMLRASRAISDNAILNARRQTEGFSRGFKNVEELDRQLRASGSSLEDLKRRAEELGITIVDAKGRITAQGLDALNKALQLAAERAVRFSQSFEDQSAAAALRRRVLGTNAPEDVFRDTFEVFRKAAPELAKGFFEGIDTTTKAGRDEFRRQLLKFVDDFIAGVIPVADFGELDKNTIIEVVNTWLDSLDEMSDAAKQVAGEMVNVADGFAVSNRVFKSLTQGLNSRDATQFRDLIKTTPTPVPVPIPVGGDNGVPGTVTVDVGGITVSPNVPATGAARYNEIRRQAIDKARTISPAAVEAVQQALPPL
jgi:hypothetical protein